MRDGQRDAFVKRGSEERGLSVARVSHGGDALAVDPLVGDEIVHAAMESPGPGRDRAAVRRFNRSAGCAILAGADAVGDIAAVGIDVGRAEGGEGVAAIEDLGDGPVLLLGTPGRGGGVVVDAASAILVEPAFGQRDARVVADGVVPAEVHREEGRHASLDLVWRDDHQADARRILASALDRHDAEGSESVQEVGMDHHGLVLEVIGLRGQRAVHVILEELLQFGATLVAPFARRLHGGSGQHAERVRQFLLGWERRGFGEIRRERQATAGKPASKESKNRGHAREYHAVGPEKGEGFFGGKSHLAMLGMVVSVAERFRLL